jgi:hypothetical protein
MTSEFITRDEKSCSDPARAVGDLATAVNTGAGTFSAASGTNQEAESSGSHRHSPLNAWLVVLSCFLLNFNLLGISYAYGQRLRFHVIIIITPE